MLHETLMPLLHLENEQEKGKGRDMGQQRQEEVPGFPSESEVRNVFSMYC